MSDDWCVIVRDDGSEYVAKSETLPHVGTIYEGTKEDCEFFVAKGVELGVPEKRNQKIGSEEEA